MEKERGQPRKPSFGPTWFSHTATAGSGSPGSKFSGGSLLGEVSLLQLVMARRKGGTLPPPQMQMRSSEQCLDHLLQNPWCACSKCRFLGPTPDLPGSLGSF